VIAPVRVQLSRAKGWRMPPNTVKVDRTTRWGNPWRVENERKWNNGWVVLDPDWSPRPLRHYCEGAVSAVRLAVALYRDWMATPFAPDVSELRGLNLACWCKPHLPCHADVLLELANP
jgi:hypothetical protein